MIVSDSAAGLSTALTAVLLLGDSLAIWHIYLMTFLNSAANIFQLPAYAAATTLLVPGKHLSRANGLVQLAEIDAALSYRPLRRIETCLPDVGVTNVL